MEQDVLNVEGIQKQTFIDACPSPITTLYHPPPPTKTSPIHNPAPLDLTEPLQLEVGLTHEDCCHLEEIIP